MQRSTLYILLAAAGVGVFVLTQKNGRGSIPYETTGLSLIVPDRAVYGFDPGFDVQRHLEKHNSVLKDMKFGTIPFRKTAAEIITQVAHDHNVKPQYLLVALDREQGLVSGIGSRLRPSGFFSKNDPALQRALDWATGYGAWHGKPESEWATKFKGFQRQLEGSASAANQAREGRGPYADLPSLVSKGGTMKLVEGSVKPANVASAMFYRYTPTAGVGKFNRALYARHAPELLQA